MYSNDYRRRAAAFKDGGHTFNELKEAFQIPPETYCLWKEKLENGYYDIKITRERRRKTDKNELKQAIAEKPDAYLRELAEKFGCTAAAVFYALRKIHITRKKNFYLLWEIRRTARRIYGQAKEGPSKQKGLY